MTTAPRRLLLHIGTHKTGSSSIQRALARTELRGGLRRARYPTVAGENDHCRLAWPYVPYEDWPPAQRAWYPADRERREEVATRYRRRLFAQLRRANCAILSSEVLVWLPVDAIFRLRRDLEDVGFQDFRVVLYIRDPADYYVSWVQQLLKGSGRVVNPISFRLPVRQIAEQWDEVFPGSLVVRHYSSDANFDVVQDFSGITEGYLGVSVPSAPARLNETLSAEGMEIQQRYRGMFWAHRERMGTADSWRLVEFLHRSRSVVPQTRPELRPEVAAWIRGCHREDYAFVARRYGVDLKLDWPHVPEPTEFDRDSLRVADVLQRVDPDAVAELWFRIAKEGLDWGPPTRGLAVRVASRLQRMYRSRRGQVGGTRGSGHEDALDPTATAGRALLHIGTFKTGSTSIQEALARADIRGDLGPVCYPLGGFHRFHLQLAWSYLPYERRRPQERFSDAGKRAKKHGRFRRETLDALRGANRAVLSAEDFSWLSVAEIRKLRRDLEGAGFGVFRVAVYVRDPADYYLSWIQQLLKVSEYVVNPVSFRCPFRRVIAAWDEVFPGCVVVRPYSGDPNFDVVQDFSSVLSEFLGVGLPGIAERANTTMSAEGMAILQRYRGLFWSDRDGVGTPDSLQLVEFLGRSHTVVSQTRPELRPEIAAWIRSNHRDDLAFIADRHGVDLRSDCADAALPHEFDRANLLVADVLRRVDDNTMAELVMRTAKEGLDRDARKRALPVRIAQRASRVGRVRRLLAIRGLHGVWYLAGPR